MIQIDAKLYDTIYRLMSKTPVYTEINSTVLPKATYKAHYLVVDKNWYEISESFCNVFLNMDLIIPNGTENKDYYTYLPTKQVLNICRMCLKSIEQEKSSTENNISEKYKKEMYPVKSNINKNTIDDIEE